MHQVLGTCHHDCPDSCGWVADVDDGVVVKLRGNSDHPYSKGELCPKVNRFLDRVYSPERILHPLIRVGEKGEAHFRKATWDEALKLVADRLGHTKARYGGEAILPWWDAGTQGLIQMSSLDRRFFAKLGSSRLTGSLCGETAGAGVAATYGSGRGAEPTDVRFAKLVILWATNTRLTNRHLWPFVEEARANGAQVIVIDPIRTMTAEAADWFIQPLPGTDIAMMLAMMHVLIRDGLIDQEYIESYSEGFPRLAESVAEWTPERAEAVCGVSAGEIERLAGAYARTRPAFIRTLIGAEHHADGAMFFRTIACLPVLTGAWRERGGGLARSVAVWADDSVDDSVFEPPDYGGTRREINMNELGQALTSDLDPPVKTLLVWNGNPVVSVPNSGLIRSGLEREDLFTVVSEQFVTDTARYADVVFPATTQLEQEDAVVSWGHMYLGWNHKAIDPLGESVPNTELWRRLSAAMGFSEPALFESDESLLRSALSRVDLDDLMTRGFVRLDIPDELTPYRHGGFATASGKALLWSDDLAAEGHGGPPAYRAKVESSFPLRLLTPKQHVRFLNTSYTHLPKHGPAEGGPFVEIDVVDAQERGIEEGDLVTVWNDRGSLDLPAKLSSRLRQGVVAIPFGWQAIDHGLQGTANTLTSDAPTDWGGGVAFSDTRVDLTLAPGKAR